MSSFVLEHVACDLCGCPKYTVRYRKPDNWLWLNQFEYPVVECVDCGLTYVNPRPTFEGNSQFYPVGYHDGRDDEAHLRRYERQYSFVRGLNPQRVLDVGCARGDWLSFLRGKWPGAELHGVDAFSSGVKDNHLHFHRCVLPDVRLPDEHFDLITSWAVFEHLHEPGSYFDVVARLLKPGGKFVFLVTNSESCYGKHAYMEDVPRHLYHFSQETLRRYAEKCNLKVEGIHFDDALWDGRGFGTFRFLFGRIFGWSWERMYLRRVNWLQRGASLAGAMLDRIVFSLHWEARLRRSGIMVAVFTK